ncbi:hypothetical protein INR49_011488 [Caranx melampygus]|nr:hypothetical protein INR49_011488 [Caranx melampygus]
MVSAVEAVTIVMVEAQRSQKGDHHAGNEEVKDVEGGTSLQVEGEAERQVTLLHIEGEEGHVHGAGAFGDGRLVPHDLTIVTENNVGLHGAGELIVSTAMGKVEEVMTLRPHPPVIENNIRPPDIAAGYADGVEAIVVLLLPGKWSGSGFAHPGEEKLSVSHNVNIWIGTIWISYHVDDLGERDLQRDIDDVVSVLHRPQGVGVVGEQVIEQLLSEATRIGNGPQPEAMSRPSSAGAGGGGLGTGKAGGGKHGGSGGAAAAAAAAVAAAAAAAAAATAGVSSVSGSGSAAPSSAVSLAVTGLPGQSTELTALFECPVCFDYVLPPILQCQAGHLVCNQCRQKLSCCPTCRGPLTPSIRNLAMEKVASTLPFPCKKKKAVFSLLLQ